VAYRSRRDKGGTELPWGEQVLSFSRQLEFLLLALGESNVPFTGSKIVGSLREKLSCHGAPSASLGSRLCEVTFCTSVKHSIDSQLFDEPV
jgi:hypothetical protein